MESQQKQRLRTFVFKNVDAFLIMTILYTVFCVSCPYVNMHSKIKRLETQALIRVTIRTIFPRCILSRISILPKISKIWLCLCVQTDVCRYDIGSLCFLNALEVLLNQSHIEILARTRPGKMASMVTLGLMSKKNFKFLFFGKTS